MTNGYPGTRVVLMPLHEVKFVVQVCYLHSTDRMYEHVVGVCASKKPSQLLMDMLIGKTMGSCDVLQGFSRFSRILIPAQKSNYSGTVFCPQTL